MNQIKNALLLSGGGARAAYQVGVIKAIDDYHFTHLNKDNALFDIFCGVSAGGINALHMACNNDNPHHAIDSLVTQWQEFHVEKIYRTDNISIMKNAYPWLKTLIPFQKNKPSKNSPMSFLDNAPLRTLLNTIPYHKLQELITSNEVHACSITCSSYHSGQSVTFFEGQNTIKEWDKERRIGVVSKLTTDHLLASSALPLIFPAQLIGSEWFGDGSMRQQAPLSPAIHLGADRIMVIGTGKNAQFNSRSLVNAEITLPMTQKPYPTLAQIGGHILNGLFVDSLFSDIDRLNKTNDLIKKFGTTEGLNVKTVDLFILNPSRKIDEIANQFIHELPKSILKLLSRIGATERLGGGLASYLLFESSYCKELIQIGYEDAWHNREQIADFLQRT
jgi:NTE family protein